MIVAMPHCGMAANSSSGGEVMERELLPRLPAYGIEPHVLAPQWRGLRWWNSPVWFRQGLRQCLRLHGPRMIRAHSLRYTGPAAILMGRRWHVPVWAHYHHLEGDRLAWLDRWVLSRADLITTDSEFSQRRKRPPMAVKAPLLAIPLGVDHARFRPMPMPTGRLVLVMGGNKPRKNIAWLEHLVWPEVVRHVSGAQLYIVGPGYFEPADEDMAEFYRMARVVCMPSTLEGFGLPVLEAMATARPVVCSDQGALPEFGALSTVALKAERWVDWIVRYLTDDQCWQAAAEINAVRSLAYSWEKTAALTAAAIGDIHRDQCSGTRDRFSDLRG